MRLSISGCSSRSSTNCIRWLDSGNCSVAGRGSQAQDTCLSTVVVVALAFRAWQGARSLEVRFAALLLASVLVAPHLTIYDLVILAPALLLLANWLPVNTRRQSVFCFTFVSSFRLRDRSRGGHTFKSRCSQWLPCCTCLSSTLGVRGVLSEQKAERFGEPGSPCAFAMGSAFLDVY